MNPASKFSPVIFILLIALLSSPLNSAAFPDLDRQKMQLSSSTNDLSQLSIGDLSLKFFMQEAGLINISLTTKKVAPVKAKIIDKSGARFESNDIAFMAGTARVRRLRGETAIQTHAGIYVTRKESGVRILHIPLELRDLKRRNHASRNYEVIVRLGRLGNILGYRLRRGPPHLQVAEALRCGMAAVPHNAVPMTMPFAEAPLLAAATTHYINMYIDVDSRFYALYGADTSSIVAIILDGVNTIYSAQLGYELRFAGLTIFSDSESDPFISGDLNADTLLESYRNYAIARDSNDADIQHLFTSRRALTNAIGYGYVGVACEFSDFAVAWNDYASGFARFVQTTAHELGHNLGGDHDFNDVQSIMSGTGQADTSDPYFSTLSLNEISSFVTSNGSCLSNEGGALPTPGTIQYPDVDESASRISISIRVVKKRSGRGFVRGRVVSSINGPLQGRVVELIKLRSRELRATTFTNSNGRYSFQVAPRGGYFTADRMSQKSSVARLF